MQVSDPALRFWLSTTFQNTIEVSQHLSKLEAPEETPYVHKYTAIKALKTLLEREHTFHFIVQLALAELYSEVDQLSDSVRSYEAALVSLSRLPKGQLPLFGNYLLVLFNMLGLTYINREDSQQGIGCLAKAMNIYEQLKGSLAHGPDFYHSRADKPNGRTFRYFYQGGINKGEFEDSHTLTLFYLAQAYTKLGLKDKAAENCGFTLQRQYETQKYEINDFCHNLIGLAEYYEGKKYFAQGVYLLMVAIEALPKETDRKRKMRAKVQTAIGETEARMLEQSV